MKITISTQPCRLFEIQGSGSIKIWDEKTITQVDRLPNLQFHSKDLPRRLTKAEGDMQKGLTIEADGEIGLVWD